MSTQLPAMEQGPFDQRPTINFIMSPALEEQGIQASVNEEVAGNIMRRLVCRHDGTRYDRNWTFNQPASTLNILAMTDAEAESLDGDLQEKHRAGESGIIIGLPVGDVEMSEPDAKEVNRMFGEQFREALNEQERIAVSERFGVLKDLGMTALALPVAMISPEFTKEAKLSAVPYHLMRHFVVATQKPGTKKYQEGIVAAGEMATEYSEPAIIFSKEA